MSYHSFISDDSAVSDYNSKSAFRVSVCLKRFFKDFRSRCYIIVKRNRRVRWLEKRLKKIFGITSPFCLCTNGHFLPSCEPLTLLAPENTLEVIPINEDIAIPQCKDSITSNVNNELEINVSKDLTNLQSSTNTCIPVVDHNEATLKEGNEKNINNNIIPEDDSDVSMFVSNDKVDGKVNTNKEQHNEDANLNIMNNLRNGHVDTNDMSYYLQELKQRALALLDSQCSAQGGSEAELDEPPLKRTRRRVRRRSRRSAQPERSVDTGPLEPTATDHHTSVSKSLTGPVESLPSNCQEKEIVVPSLAEEICSPALPEVQRNQVASSRKPRVVHPLGVEI